MGCQKHCRAVQLYASKLGRARKLSKTDETALFEYLMAEGWRQQDEIVYWLWHERGALVSRPYLVF
ncbi:hypothetical protein Egran_01324 [Elaphomyces granulatus]|uniref:Uncharacterized protein n=1 Tax=Elaphomyces granulatus TaxID=519963 RepID=A0A232M3G1_9EURO|nr:hypothetical protein Egran_01324 [Elaphomyces granulatus]